MTSHTSSDNFVSNQMPLLLSLPVPLAAILMQQIMRTDRLFPIERQELNRLLQSLHTPRSAEMETAVQAFASLKLSSQLRHFDWQRDPATFVDKMTAELWASNQIDTFRAAAKTLVPPSQELATTGAHREPRCVVIVLDKTLCDTTEPAKLFSKLRPYGTFFPAANDASGPETLHTWINNRTTTDPAPYAHWNISGTAFSPEPPPPVVALSFDQLSATRTKILTMFDRERHTPSGGADGLRQALLYVTPDEMGLASMQDPILRTFALDLFTAGSGTQLYATTFVQWTIREALRRAQPQTVVGHFTPRSTATSMDERLAHPELDPPPDAAGSLIDADMGAYMSYLNLQRLPGSHNAGFLAWHESYGQAVLIGPQMPAGTFSAAPIQMSQLLSLLSPPA